MANDVGLGGNPLATASVVAGPTHSGRWFIRAVCRWLVHVHTRWLGQDDSFTYKVTDAGGNISNTATVTLDTPFNAATGCESRHVHRGSGRHAHGAGSGCARQ